jgi:hypothetical protein
MNCSAPNDTPRREYIFTRLGSVENIEAMMSVMQFPPSVTWRNISDSRERQLFDEVQRQEARNAKR